VCGIYSIPAVGCFHCKKVIWDLIKGQLANDKAKIHKKDFEKQGES
jgi:hypothetical protein